MVGCIFAARAAATAAKAEPKRKAAATAADAAGRAGSKDGAELAEATAAAAPSVRSAITLADLIQRGLVKPGEGVLTIEYMVGGQNRICERGARRHRSRCCPRRRDLRDHRSRGRHSAELYGPPAAS